MSVAESPLSGAYSLPGMGASGVRALLRATADAAAANARACDATVGAMPPDREALVGRRERHAEAAAALRQQAATLRPATTRAAAEQVARVASQGAKFTSTTGDARLRQDLKACTGTALTVAVARKAARNRARARQQANTARRWKRLPADTNLPRPTIEITTGATESFHEPQTMVSCEDIDLTSLPIVNANIHSGRHPSIIQRTIFDAGFQTALHAAKKVLQDLMDAYAGDEPHPGTPTFRINLGSPHGLYRAIAVGFALKASLRLEGFGTKLRMKGGHDPCRCTACSTRASVAATSPEAQARLARIWGARPRLWPPRIQVTAPEDADHDPDEDPQDLQELYARQGQEDLPPPRPRKLKPNRGSQQALTRRRTKLRLKSVGALNRRQLKLRPDTEPPRGSRDPPPADRAASEISLDACRGSPPASEAGPRDESAEHQCVMWTSPGSSRDESSRDASEDRGDR